MNKKKENIIWHSSQVTKKERAVIKNQKPCVLWFTGLSASGKSTVANEVELKLNKLRFFCLALDATFWSKGTQYLGK